MIQLFELSRAFHSLRKNVMRTSLSILGITIGIATLIMVISIGAGVENLILSQIQSIGADTLFVEIKVPTGDKESANARAFLQGVMITTLKESDANQIKKLPNIEKIYAATTGQVILTNRNDEIKSLFWATTHDLIDINDFNLDKGRFYTDAESKSLARVVVLGHGIAEKLFENENPINKKIKIDRVSFTVIGVVEERGIEFFQNQDELIFIPLRTAQKLLLGVDHILFMGMRMIDAEKLESTTANIQNLLRKRHNILDATRDDFAVRDLEEAADILGSVSFGVTVLLLLVAAISLLVGGVGIMNVMYVSVSERTHEIGLLKAIGARGDSILLQFIYEAIIITSVGGILGVIIGSGFSYLAAIGARSQDIEWAYIITPQSVIFATVSSMIIGLIFGYYPAKKAAQLNPIDALRWE